MNTTIKTKHTMKKTLRQTIESLIILIEQMKTRELHLCKEVARLSHEGNYLEAAVAKATVNQLSSDIEALTKLLEES